MITLSSTGVDKEVNLLIRARMIISHFQRDNAPLPKDPGGGLILYRCPKCPWRRTLTDDRELQIRMYDHPVYGRVIGAHMALLDVERHDCITHTDAIARFQEVEYGVGRN
jgi:hypothetical protein